MKLAQPLAATAFVLGNLANSHSKLKKRGESPTNNLHASNKALPEGAGARSQPFSEVFGKAAASQKEYWGAPSKEIVKVGNTTSDNFETLVSELTQRAKDVGVNPELVLGLSEDGNEVLLRPLAKALTMMQYEEHYDISIGSVVLSSLSGPTLDEEKRSELIEKLRQGEPIGIIAINDFHSHSAGVVMKLDAASNTLHAVSVDTINAYDNYLPPAIGRLFSVDLDSTLEYKRVSSEVSQADDSSCHAVSCLLVADLLKDGDPNWAIDFKAGDPAPPLVLRAAQRPEYLEKNGFDPNIMFRKQDPTTLGAHRAEHTVTDDADKKVSHFLKAKTLQLANTTLNYLEKLGDIEKDDHVRSILEKAYPGNMVSSFRRVN